MNALPGTSRHEDESVLPNETGEKLTLSHEALEKVSKAFEYLSGLIDEAESYVKRNSKKLIVGTLLTASTFGAAAAEKPHLSSEEAASLKLSLNEWRYEKPTEILKNEQIIIEKAKTIKAAKDTVVDGEHLTTKRFLLSPKIGVRIEYVNDSARLFVIKQDTIVENTIDGKKVLQTITKIVSDGSIDGSKPIDGVVDHVEKKIDGKEVLSYTYREGVNAQGETTIYLTGISVLENADEFNSGMGMAARNIIGAQMPLDSVTSSGAGKITQKN